MSAAYAMLMAAATGKAPLRPIKIPGGASQGRVVVTPEEPELRRPKLEGFDYINELIHQDELEDEMEEEAKPKANLSNLGSSIGTRGLVHELHQMNLVYDKYRFAERSSGLLIDQFKDSIIRKVDTHNVVIIKGPTGCGKSTQVPQFILDSSRASNIHCNIVVTQPRRIAAISVAKRVSQERNWNVGGLVGYQVALDKKVSEDTRLLYCTAGVLLQQIIQRRELSMYTHIIIDEVHERDNETDFLLIVIKRLLRRPENRIKLILMSATLTADRFQDYFSKKVRGEIFVPPVIDIQLPTSHKVTFCYLESLSRLPINLSDVTLEMDDPKVHPKLYELAVLLIEVFNRIDEQEASGDPGDQLGSVLIFLPGIAEIETMFEYLEDRKKKYTKEKWWLCPLHSSVTFDEQVRVFKLAPEGFRKIIIATNIAESSITVPDVKYVIDFCLMKLLMQEPDTCHSSLHLNWISKSHGIQRAGRVGRVRPGRVYRLVNSSFYEKFEDECTPEILRCPLDVLVLRSKVLDMGTPTDILGRAMDPPNLNNIARTVLNLKELGALLPTVDGVYNEKDGDLTPIGRVMEALPISPQLSKTIILGHVFGCVGPAIIMACAMSIKSILSSPFKKVLESYNSKLFWAGGSCSDPIAFYHAYTVWRRKTVDGEFGRRAGTTVEEWAEVNFLQLKSLREVARLEADVRNRLVRFGIVQPESEPPVPKKAADDALILKIILAGASFPNFFEHQAIDEKDAVRTLGGRDPFRTVFLKNFPSTQPGPLYTTKIKSMVESCRQLCNDISVTFDGSSKVYIMFDSTSEEKASIPGRINMAVYRAVKLRLAKVPLDLPLLPISEARARAQRLLGDDDINPISAFAQRERSINEMESIVPGVLVSTLPVNVVHIDSPGSFFVHKDGDTKCVWLDQCLDDRDIGNCHIPESEVYVGRLCLAPYSEDNYHYYRARILIIDHEIITVVFIDYGNVAEVNIHELRDFTPKMRSLGVHREPAQCLKCYLAEIKPVESMGPAWSHKAIAEFKKYFDTRKGVALIYSITHNVLAIYLFSPNQSTYDPENSFNRFLVQEGLAERCDEPYLSRENHLLRLSRSSRTDQTDTDPVRLDFVERGTNIRIDDSECRGKVTLSGPYSPLEVKFRSLTRQTRSLEAVMEKTSVNSVFLDQSPMDPHPRMLIAMNVTITPTRSSLTIRESTLMPNIHGLLGFLSMIFSPKTELRTDSDLRELTGALCGLGYDENTGIPYNSPNDMEIVFDVEVDIEDMATINKIRFWLNQIMDSMVPGGADVDLKTARSKIREYLLKLLSRRRQPKPLVYNSKEYKWNLLPEDSVIRPVPNVQTNCVFPYIEGVELNEGARASAHTLMKIHIAQLREMVQGLRKFPMAGAMCNLCQMNLDSLSSLKIHLETAVHLEYINRPEN